jgi:hypothetical protein
MSSTKARHNTPEATTEATLPSHLERSTLQEELNKLHKATMAVVLAAGPSDNYHLPSTVKEIMEVLFLVHLEVLLAQEPLASNLTKFFKKVSKIT